MLVEYYRVCVCVCVCDSISSFSLLAAILSSRGSLAFRAYSIDYSIPYPRGIHQSILTPGVQSTLTPGYPLINTYPRGIHQSPLTLRVSTNQCVPRGIHQRTLTPVVSNNQHLPRVSIKQNLPSGYPPMNTYPGGEICASNGPARAVGVKQQVLGGRPRSCHCKHCATPVSDP